MSDCNVRVICRFRPTNEREMKEGSDKNVKIEFPDDSTVNIIEESNKQPQLFTLDRVFKSDTKQSDIYNLAAKDSINDVIEGFNATIFAYGQTGSGKSFTMFGPSIDEVELCGIIPRACQHIFQYINTDKSETEFTIKCSFLEIYKEEIKDLLNPSPKKLRIRESSSKGVWVEGLTELYVSTMDEILDLIKLGEKFRSVTSTNMNAVSSRSHSLFVLTLIQKFKDGSVKTGKLNLADLAGSEKVGKTGAVGNTLEEAKKINQSLSALGNCINALTKDIRSHVPYRDSKLTFILRESLGGNTKTTLLVACSPHPFNLQETLSTLRFASRAKSIKNTVTVNSKKSVEELEGMIKILLEEMKQLKLYIKHLEKEIGGLKGGDFDPELERKKISIGESIVTNSIDLNTTNELIHSIESKVKSEKMNEEFEEEINSLRYQINTLKEEETEYKSTISNLKEQISKGQESHQKLEEDLKNLQQKYDREVDQLRYTTKQISFELENERISLKSTIEKHDSIKENLNKQNEEMREMDKQLSLMQDSKKELESKILQASKLLLVSQQREKQLENKIKEFNEEKNDLKEELDLLYDDNKLTKERLETAKSQINQANLCIEESKIEISKNKKEREFMESNHNETINKLKKQILTLQEALSNTEEKKSVEEQGSFMERNKQVENLLEHSNNENLEMKKKLLQLEAQQEQKDLELKNSLRTVEELSSQIKAKDLLLEKTTKEFTEKLKNKELRVYELEEIVHQIESSNDLSQNQLVDSLKEEARLLSSKLNQSEFSKKPLVEELESLRLSLLEERNKNSLLKQKEEFSDSRVVDLIKTNESLSNENNSLKKEIETSIKTNIKNAKRFHKELERMNEEHLVQEQKRREKIVKIVNNNQTSSQFFTAWSPAKWFTTSKPFMTDNSFQSIKDTADKVGYLQKQGEWIKNWKRRWMVMKDDKIYYFETPQSIKPKGVIEISGDCFVQRADEFTKLEFSIGIYHIDKRVYFLKANDMKDLEEWMLSINKNIKKLNYLK